MIEKKFFYPKLIFVLILGFCLLYFQKATVLAESGPDLMIDNITIIGKRPSGLYVWLKNIGDVYVDTTVVGLNSLPYERPVCEINGISCNKEGYSTTFYNRKKLLANGENSISTSIDTGISGCPPEQGSFEVSVCIYWEGITDVDTSNNCKTVTLNYEDMTVPCRTDAECNTGADRNRYCQNCRCKIATKCTDLQKQGRDIYKKGYYYSGTLGSGYAAGSYGNRKTEDSCVNPSGLSPISEGGLLLERFCYVGGNAAFWMTADADNIFYDCLADSSPTDGCMLSGDYVECPSGYECRDGACREIGVEATPSPTSPPTIPGDLNGDGDIDIFDLVIVSNSFGKSLGDPGYDPRADTNGDEVVDILDLITVGSHFGEGS